MVTRYGMHERLPNLSLEREPSPLLDVPHLSPAHRYGEATAQAVDAAIRDIVAAAFERARKVLLVHRPTLEDAARLLLERETLSEADLAAIAARIAAPPEREPTPSERVARIRAETAIHASRI
jgi:cell division protease FtsH